MFQFACACGEKISADEQMTGSRLQCPGCGEHLVVPEVPAPGKTKSCPYCGAVVKVDIKKCPQCREFLDPSARPGAVEQPRPQLQPGGGLSRAEYEANSLANQSLAYAIVGLIFPCLLILQMQAITRGNKAKEAARAAQVPIPGNASAGVMLGYLGLIWLALSVYIAAARYTFDL